MIAVCTEIWVCFLQRTDIKLYVEKVIKENICGGTMVKKCDVCGRMFQTSSPGWRSCPYCGGQNYCPVPLSKQPDITAIIICCIAGGFFIFMLLAALITVAVIDTDCEEYAASSYSESREMSGDAVMAEEYIKNLPAGQRDAIIRGGGSYEDRANAIANLIKDGQLQGAADYFGN